MQLIIFPLSKIGWIKQGKKKEEKERNGTVSNVSGKQSVPVCLAVIPKHVTQAMHKFLILGSHVARSSTDSPGVGLEMDLNTP